MHVEVDTPKEWRHIIGCERFSGNALPYFSHGRTCYVAITLSEYYMAKEWEQIMYESAQFTNERDLSILQYDHLLMKEISLSHSFSCSLPTVLSVGWRHWSLCTWTTTSSRASPAAWSCPPSPTSPWPTTSGPAPASSPTCASKDHGPHTLPSKKQGRTSQKQSERASSESSSTQSFNK